MASLRVTLIAAALLVCSSVDVSEASNAVKNRPVSKVLTLLKDMLKQLEKDAEIDQEVYDKMACWCETNDKEKTKAIADAEAKIEDLTSLVEELTATSARLTTEIKNLEVEVAKNQEALDEATAIRTKQLSEFNGEEKDLLQSISALKAAVTVLSKHHSSFLQIPSTHLLGIAATLQHELDVHQSQLKGVLTHSDRKAIGAFVQSPQDYFDASPTFKQSYAPQSGEIFGILRQMKETFESNLSQSQKDELANQKAYQDLKTAKEAEIAAGQDQLDKKTSALANTDQKLAQTKQDIVDTKASLSADEEFLMMLKEKCSMTDKEWENRQASRQEEIEAVSKALAILSSDDAHDLYTKTFNPAFLQESKGSRSRASSLLRKAAQRLHSPNLSAMAVRVRLDAFTKVKKAIDDMIAQLLKEKDDEIKHKDFCVEEFNKNDMQTDKKSREKNDLTAELEVLTTEIQKLVDELKQLNGDIAEAQLQLKRAGEDRELENKDFQTTVQDQRETQKLLQSALNVLKEVYAKALLQEPAGPPPPAGFKTYEKAGGAGGVMGLIGTIINDAKAMEVEAVRDETDAQAAYESFIKESNGSIDTKSKEIVNKSKLKADKEKTHVEKTTDLENANLELEQLSNYKAELHSSCDFITKNFEIRQTARDEEVEALRQAKSILSGAKFD